MVLRAQASDMTELRGNRAAEVWERIDSIRIGPGMRDLDQGWFNNWADFARVSKHELFRRVRSGVGKAWSNVGGEAEDWAISVYQWGVEFFGPDTLGNYTENAPDADFWPLFWTSRVPAETAVELDIASTDQLIVIPCTHAPSGTGATGGFATDMGARTLIARRQGESHITNSAKFPVPLEIPRQGKFGMTLTVEETLREFMKNFPDCPTFQRIPNCEPVSPSTFPLETVFTVRAFMRGVRYVQFRQSRST